MLKKAVFLSLFAIFVSSTVATAVPNERVEGDAKILASALKDADDGIITSKKITHLINTLKMLQERVSELEDRVKLLEKEKLLKDWKEEDPVTTTSGDTTYIPVYIYRSGN
jgi:predicted nuclease with TOPRIM domain